MPDLFLVAGIWTNIEHRPVIRGSLVLYING